MLTVGATLLGRARSSFLGGASSHFALTLIIGIVIGTYSSIYVAAPIVVIWKDWFGRAKLAAARPFRSRSARLPVPAPRPLSPAASARRGPPPATGGGRTEVAPAAACAAC